MWTFSTFAFLSLQGSEALYSGLISIVRQSAQELLVQGDLRALRVDEGIFPHYNIGYNSARLQAGHSIFVISDEPVCSFPCRNEECMLGSFIANAMRECMMSASCAGISSSQSLNTKNPTIALLESGTIRSCLLEKKTNDLSQLVPWPNKLIVLSANGKKSPSYYCSRMYSLILQICT